MDGWQIKGKHIFFIFRKDERTNDDKCHGNDQLKNYVFFIQLR